MSSRHGKTCPSLRARVTTRKRLRNVWARVRTALNDGALSDFLAALDEGAAATAEAKGVYEQLLSAQV